MKINILINGALYSSQASYSALRYCRAAVAAGHSISQVFFHRDAAAHGNSLSSVMSDEPDMVDLWAQFSDQYDVPLVVCVAAAESRGVLGAQQAAELSRPVANLHPAFKVAGLGALHEASLAADRMVTFA